MHINQEKIKQRVNSIQAYKELCSLLIEGATPVLVTCISNLKRSFIVTEHLPQCSSF